MKKNLFKIPLKTVKRIFLYSNKTDSAFANARFGNIKASSTTVLKQGTHFALLSCSYSKNRIKNK